MSQRTVWITGAGGLIGSWLLRTVPNFGLPTCVVGTTHAQLDLLQFEALRLEIQRLKPAAIIHCAALSRSPECQADPSLARRLNTELTAVLAELAADISFVFFSTDLVFDGRKGNYVETDPMNPLSVYAETKAEAEQIVLRNPSHTVVRTSLNAGPSPTGDRGFDEQIRRAWNAGQELRLFTDEFRCPIAAEVTARAVWELLQNAPPALYHVAGSERLSRWQIGQLLAACSPELRPKLVPASLAEYQGAPRSPDTSLNCAKAQGLLSFPLPGYTQGVSSPVGSTELNSG